MSRHQLHQMHSGTGNPRGLLLRLPAPIALLVRENLHQQVVQFLPVLLLLAAARRRFREHP